MTLKELTDKLTPAQRKNLKVFNQGGQAIVLYDTGTNILEAFIEEGRRDENGVMQEGQLVPRNQATKTALAALG